MPAKTISFQKKILFAILLIPFTIVGSEISSHLLYRCLRGKFLWERKDRKVHVFRIRSFTERVDDERIITNKKNFSSDRLIQTDSNGFRTGTHHYFSDKENLVFLGSSVLFGWKVDGRHSAPSLCFDLITKRFSGEYGVINAAIPSYSLYQAIKRYEIEIYGKYPVQCVILQTYDPVSQFLMWGRKWRKEMCWATGDTFIATKHFLEEQPLQASFWYRYSTLFNVFVKLIHWNERMPSPLAITDRQTFYFFEKENFSLLESFHRLLQKDHIPLILLPINPLEDRGFRSEELFVINRLNEVFRQFASSKQDVYFFDVRSYFDQFDASEKDTLFLDRVHLSERGSRKQAEFIVEELIKNGLLRPHS